MSRLKLNEITTDPVINQNEVNAMFSTKKTKRKKKKKKKKKPKVETSSDLKSAESATISSSCGVEPKAKIASKDNYIEEYTAGELYSYDSMLKMLMEKMKMKKMKKIKKIKKINGVEVEEEVEERKVYSMKPPQVIKVGGTRCCWINFQEACMTIERKPDHVMNFFLAELGTSGSVDGTYRLTMKGRFDRKKITGLLKRYIEEYVTCLMCKSPRTVLKKSDMTRLYILHCEMCGASRSVAAIKTGFQVVKRGERRKARR